MTTPNWKPEPWKRVKARRKAKKARDRRACCDIVWTRARSRCECDDCGKHEGRCSRFLKRASTFWKEVGHVDEKIPRSQGGDPTDPTNCRLTCPDCHFSGPSGAHRITKR